jgi:hypothetical protein
MREPDTNVIGCCSHGPAGRAACRFVRVNTPADHGPQGRGYNKIWSRGDSRRRPVE